MRDPGAPMVPNVVPIGARCRTILNWDEASVRVRIQLQLQQDDRVLHLELALLEPSQLEIARDRRCPPCQRSAPRVRDALPAIAQCDRGSCPYPRQVVGVRSSAAACSPPFIPSSLLNEGTARSAVLPSPDALLMQPALPSLSARVALLALLLLLQLFLTLLLFLLRLLCFSCCLHAASFWRASTSARCCAASRCFCS